ncbi:MAG: pseudouridine synthase [Thermoguttaceae bacterium]
MMSGDKRRKRFPSGPARNAEGQRLQSRPKTKRPPARPGTAERQMKPAGRRPKPQGPRPKPQALIPHPQSPIPNADLVRLQKVLAAAGLGSRRQCEELITSGRVEVDRQMVARLGTRVDPGRQEIHVDGQPLSVGRRVYYAVNKPKGVVTTNRDPSGRPRVVDLVPGHDARLFAIGRLDLTSEGLILVTNDGELANRLTHPRYGVGKTYLAQVAGRPAPEILARLCRGVHLAEGLARAESVRVQSHWKESTWLEIVLREGQNREIRRLLAKVGHKVLRLVRTAVGPVRLGKLRPGQSRPLTPAELRAIKGVRSQESEVRS